MLNEIFKGMDNAAEQINENFQFGSIVETNLTESNPENGYYVRFGSGLQVCWHTIDITVNNSYRAEGDFIYPKAFASNPTVIPAKPWFKGGGFVESNYSVTARNEFANTLSKIPIAVYDTDSSLQTGSVLKGIGVFAIGRWK